VGSCELWWFPTSSQPDKNLNVCVCVCVVVQTEKKLMKMNEEIKKSLSLDNAVSTVTS